MQRPTGITILATSYSVGGALSLAMSCVALVVGSRLARTGDDPGDMTSSALTLDPTFRGNLVLWIGLIGTGAALTKLVAAAGLWGLRPWSLRLVLVRGTYELLTHLLAVSRGAITPSGLAGVLVNGAVVLYLTSSQVRQALTSIPRDTVTMS